MASSTVENYLKAILHLQEKTAGVTTVGEVAKVLAVTPGTVTTMMRHLSSCGWLDYAPRRELRLTEAGQKEALKVVRRHRLIELFLVEIMGLDWSEVHEEAEILEHVISDRLLKRIDEMLEHPSHDPHGDPIPDAEGRVESQNLLALDSVEEGVYRVVRVSDENSDLLGWFNEKGLVPGSEIEIPRQERTSGLIEFKGAQGETVTLGLPVAKRVFVEAV